MHLPYDGYYDWTHKGALNIFSKVFQSETSYGLNTG